MKNDRKFPPNLRLRKAREEHGWSQRELANRINTTSVNVSRWENGSTFPYPYSRLKLCEVFDETPDELGLVPPEEHDESSLVSLPPPAELSLVPPATHSSRIRNIPIMHNPFFT
nr:helix-turn-helix transcriptional regulator [Ktedonobacteraceae bacterium]